MSKKGEFKLTEDEFISRSQLGTVFNVNWLELEILKLLNRSVEPIYKGEMIQLLRSKHRSLDKKPDSSFYAVFDKLMNQELIGYARIEGMGYKTYLELTSKGGAELLKSLNWAISTIIEGMIGSVIDVLRNICHKNLGCLSSSSFGIISLSNPDLLIPDVCNSCVNITPNEAYQRYHILMPFSQDIFVESFQNIRATPDDIPLKSEILSRFLSVMQLGLNSDDQSETYLAEIKRLLVPGGKVAFLELRSFESYLFDALGTITNGFSLYLPKKETQQLKQFEDNELKTKIEAVFGEGSVEIVDMREFVFAVATR